MRVFCSECWWYGENTEVLTAQNPFDPGQSITGCPGCKSVVAQFENLPPEEEARVLAGRAKMAEIKGRPLI